MQNLERSKEAIEAQIQEATEAQSRLESQEKSLEQLLDEQQIQRQIVCILLLYSQKYLNLILKRL
jgi:hypothetical protein